MKLLNKADLKLATALRAHYGDCINEDLPDIVTRINREIVSVVYHGRGDGTLTQNPYCALNVFHERFKNNL